MFIIINIIYNKKLNKLLLNCGKTQVPNNLAIWCLIKLLCTLIAKKYQYICSSSCNCNLRFASSQGRSHLMIWGQKQWGVLQKPEKRFMLCGAALNALGEHALHLVRKLEVRHDAMLAIIILLLIIWTYYSYTLRMSSSVAVPAHIASTIPRLDLFEYRWLCTLRGDFSWA